jgi:cell division septation protein DedD
MRGIVSWALALIIAVTIGERAWAVPPSTPLFEWTGIGAVDKQFENLGLLKPKEEKQKANNNEHKNTAGELSQCDSERGGCSACKGGGGGGGCGGGAGGGGALGKAGQGGGLLGGGKLLSFLGGAALGGALGGSLGKNKETPTPVPVVVLTPTPVPVVTATPGPTSVPHATATAAAYSTPHSVVPSDPTIAVDGTYSYHSSYTVQGTTSSSATSTDGMITTF